MQEICATGSRWEQAVKIWRINNTSIAAFLRLEADFCVRGALLMVGNVSWRKSFSLWHISTLFLFFKSENADFGESSTEKLKHWRPLLTADLTT